VTGIDTGIGFFDHMLTLLAVHGSMDLELRVRGDLAVDAHHTVEDAGIALGSALREALGDRRGVRRYATRFVPMDETLAMVSLDLCTRAYVRFDPGPAGPLAGRLGAMEMETVPEFFRAFAMNGSMTLHANILYGENTHHRAEALFKALGQALRKAARVEGEGTRVFSTKGVL
jgi:imidazoleglycerol-phosphate dehydratase